MYNHTQEQVSGSMSADPINIGYTQVYNQQKKDWAKNLKGFFYQAKQLIEANKSEHTTVTLTTTFHRPVGEANPYIQIVCSPQTICNHTQRQVSGYKKADNINANKQIKNQWRKDDN